MMQEIDRLAAAILSNASDWFGAPVDHRLRTVRISDVSPRPVEWLWPGRIPLGQLTLISGQSGLGKSFLTLDLAARTSRGAPFPGRGDPSQPPGTVILFSLQDDVAGVIRPRLEDAGADLSRILAVDRVESDPAGGPGNGTRGFSLEKDLPALTGLLEENPETRLVVIDPLGACCPGLDSSKSALVGQALARLAEAAAAHDVAIVAVNQMPRGRGAFAFDRWLASDEPAAAARAAWHVAKDRDDPQRRLLLPMKMNLCASPTGLAYRIKQGRVEWERRPLKMTAAELLATEREQAGGDRTERQVAAEWLREILADGPLPAREVKQQAWECGFTPGTVRRAMKLAGVRPVKSGFEKGAQWVWSLVPDSRGAHREEGPR